MEWKIWEWFGNFLLISIRRYHADSQQMNRQVKHKDSHIDWKHTSQQSTQTKHLLQYTCYHFDHLLCFFYSELLKGKQHKWMIPDVKRNSANWI